MHHPRNLPPADPAIMTRVCRFVLCTLKPGSFEARVFGYGFPWLGKEAWHEGIEVHGRPEGICDQAGRGRDADGGGVPRGWHQPGDVLQLEEEVRRAAVHRDAVSGRVILRKSVL